MPASLKGHSMGADVCHRCGMRVELVWDPKGNPIMFYKRTGVRFSRPPPCDPDMKVPVDDEPTGKHRRVRR